MRLAVRFRSVIICSAIMAVSIYFMATPVQAGWEAPLPKGKDTLIHIPRIAKPPVIDGTIDESEWRGAAAVSGVGGCMDNQLYARPTTFFLAWDPDHLYMAIRVWVRPGYKPAVSGRLSHSAPVFDDCAEFNWQPSGKNVAPGRTSSSYKFLVNAIGVDGDFQRVAVGQQFKNWNPEFKTAARLTDTGTAPLGGRWLEMEFSSTFKDFELTGPHQAGDVWRMMLGFNHMYIDWSQGRIPATSSYFDAGGFPVCVLVEDEPVVQELMETLPGPMDGMASVAFKFLNPTAQKAKLTVQARYTEFTKASKDAPEVESELLKKEQSVEIETGKTGEIVINEKYPRERAKSKGAIFYQVSQGERELFRYFIYMPESYPKSVFEPFPKSSKAFPVDGSFNPVRNTFWLTADAYYLDKPDDAKQVRYRVVKQGSDKPFLEGTIDKPMTNFFRRLLQLPADLAPGEYAVETFMRLADGRELGPERANFKKLDEAKEFSAWWNTKLGNVDRVIFPFKAIVRKDAEVSPAGRTYRLDAIGLPEEIVSNGKPVSAGAARIVVVKDGKEISVPLTGMPKFTETTDWRVSFTGEAKGGGLAFGVKGWIEQDGLCYLELTYGPDGAAPAKIDALRIEFPISSEQGEVLLCLGTGGNYASRTTMILPQDGKQGRIWSTLDTGKNGSGMVIGSFYPCVWIGNERRGLLWDADNDKGWIQDDAVPAHELLRQGKDLTLRNNIVGKPGELAAPRTVAFTYMASPFRPMVKGWRAAIYSEDGTFEGPNKKRKDPKTGEEIDGWAWLTPPSRDPSEWSTLWADFKKIADARCHDIQPFNPSLARNKYGSTVHTSLPLMGYDWKSPDKTVTGYFGPEWEGDTYNKTEQDYFLWIADRAFGEGGLRTIYWDIFFNSLQTSLQAGMSYELPDGRIQPGFNGLNIRRFMMRLYSVMEDHKLTPGSQVSHATNDYCLVASGWMDAILDGEYHSITDDSGMDWVDGYPIERMRAMSVSGQFGSQISWMNLISIKDPRKAADARRGFADYPFLFDSWKNPNSSSDVPRAALDWGLNDERVNYVPFWRNALVTSDDKDILISAWTLPKRTILCIFNNNRSTVKEAIIRLDMKALGLTVKTPWQEGVVARSLYGAAAELFSDGLLRVPELAPHSCAIIGIRASEREDEKLLPGLVEQAKLANPAVDTKGIVVPTAILDWGMADAPAEYFPTGKATEISCADQSLKVAMWRLPDRVLLSVVNTDATAAKDAVVSIDLGKLNLLPKLQWQEFVGVRDFCKQPQAKPASLDFYTGKLSIPGIPPHGERLVGVRLY